MGRLSLGWHMVGWGMGSDGIGWDRMGSGAKVETGILIFAVGLRVGMVFWLHFFIRQQYDHDMPYITL